MKIDIKLLNKFKNILGCEFVSKEEALNTCISSPICYVIDLKKKEIHTLGEFDSFDGLNDKRFVYVRPVYRKDKQTGVMYCNCDHKPETVNKDNASKIECNWCRKETPYYRNKNDLIELWNEMVVTYDPNIKVKLIFGDGSSCELGE